MKTSIKSIISIMIIGLMMTSLFSCKDKEETTSTVQGEWNWISTSGGLLGVHHTPTSTGINITYKFNEDFSFEELIDGVSTRTGDFTVTSSTSVESLNLDFDGTYEPDANDIYVLHENSFTLTVENNTLILGDNVPADGFLYEFEKVE